MIYDSSFGKKPIISEPLYETLKDTPLFYKYIADLCALAILGVSEKDVDFAKRTLNDIMEPDFDLTVLERRGNKQIFWSNRDNNFWQYVIEVPGYYRTFFDRCNKEVHFVSIN